METGALLSVMAATAVNSAMPGPCMILIAARTALAGPWAGLRTSLGIAAAQMIYATVAFVLLMLALSISDTVHTVIRGVGAGVLMLLAINMLRATRQGATPRMMSPVSTGTDALVGFGVGLSSPFNLIFMFSVLPQFVSREAMASPDIALVFAGIFLATMGPMIATICAANGTRMLAHRFVPLLVRSGAFLLIVFAGMSVMSISL